MVTITSSTTYRPYRAPQRDDGIVVDPPLSNATALLQQADGAERVDLEFAGRSLSSLRGEARREVVRAAVAYTGTYRDVPPLNWQAPIVMAGHQPELFHPGVWFKNFVLSRYASATGAIAINLIVDNDQNRSPSIRVPAQEGKRVVWKRVAIDTAPAGVPYEQQRITDRPLFDSFPARVAELIDWIEPNPLVHSLWQHAKASADRCGNMACTLAQARHQLEAEVGLKSLEVPLSTVSRGGSFLAFALSIVGQLPRFQACYNDAVAHYRRAHHIRSASHPVPQLDEGDGWLEAPFWIYSDAAPQRRPAWVKQTGTCLKISDRQNVELCVHSHFDVSESAAELEQQLHRSGVKLRPRALVTTMYARLILSDLFLHGIGGGKYDQLTDRIIDAFFGITPPPFSVLSATIRLPKSVAFDPHVDLDEVRRRQRDLRFNPERVAAAEELDASLVERKHHLLTSIPPRGEKQQWHDELTAINRQLYKQAEATRAAIGAEYERAYQQTASNTILQSREHSFCIYSRASLIPRLQRLADEAISE